MADIMGLLTMSRRAGKLVLGMDEAKGACFKGDARGVLITSDLADNSAERIKGVCERTGTPIITVDDTMDNIGEALGKRSGIIAVNDSGFWKAIVKKLAPEND